MRQSEQQSAKRRLATILSGLIACLASTILSAGFGLNGPQYDGWVRTFSIFAVVSIPWTLAATFFPPRLSPVRIACASVGLIVATSAVLITTSQYSDGYQGSYRWPNALAWMGLVGLLAIPAALTVPKNRSDRGRPLVSRR
jgi:peptidoglycan/LPS O-acetylase OafA/YrhL